MLLTDLLHVITQPKPTTPVVGELGGIPVSMPRSFVRFVEYDKSPHFMAKNKEDKPQRTPLSRLRSFGFEVRYPDIDPKQVKTKEEKNNHTTMWMSVGVTTREYYGSTGDKSLENKKNIILIKTRHVLRGVLFINPSPLKPMV